MKKRKDYLAFILVCILFFFVGYFTNNVKINNYLEKTNCLQNSENDVKNEETIEISVFGKKIFVEEKRLQNHSLVDNKLDNRWELAEVDTILQAIRGKWKVDKYIGFVPANIYFPDLFASQETLSEDIRENLYREYDELVQQAQDNVPDITFTVKEGEVENENYIYVNDSFKSPFSMILSMERDNDYYPCFLEETTVSSDFYVKYPVIYIRIFVNVYEEETCYMPATLILTSDDNFIVLIDGAFYLLEKYDVDLDETTTP